MTVRGPGALMVAAAVALQLGYTNPARARARGVADEYKGLRDERREVAATLAATQRRQSALTAALQGTRGQILSREGAVADARQAIVAALAGSRLGSVQLSVRPGAPPAAAVVHVAGVGPFRDVMAFSGRLLDPGGGLVLSEARFRPSGSVVGLDLSLVRLGPKP